MARRPGDHRARRGDPVTERLSYSQLNSWAGCGERYRLERIVQVPQRPAWNLIGGSTVHELTEQHDLSRLGVDTVSYTFDEVFERRTVEAEQNSGFDRTEFRSSGRASKDWPNKEDNTWWAANGPAMVNRWVTFVNNVPWDIWVTPDGKPAVELDFLLPLFPDGTGEPTVEVKGFIDRVMVDRDGNLIVVDVKTGASKQPTARQLGVYRVGLLHRFGVEAAFGSFWDARSGSASPLVSLANYDLARVTWQYEQVRRARALNIYIPNPGPLCGSCSVNESCYEFSLDAPERGVRPPWVSVEEWNGAAA